MKVKMLCRNPDEYLRETKKDIHKVPRNKDPALIPFAKEREYTRAMNAVKLERVFAKPFITSLDGHKDGVHVMANHPTSLSYTLSGSYDGEVRLWNLATRKCVWKVNAHSGFVRGIDFHRSGEYFYTCGEDQVIKQWSMEQQTTPMNTILGKTVFHGLSHNFKSNVFATCGEQVDIWDETRTTPINSYKWGLDSIHAVKFNPSETQIVGAAGSDRSILLYDMRGTAPLRKVLLKLRTNSIAWNPMQPFVFTTANEDYNLYSFDMRNLRSPLQIHMDHVSAVLDVCYAPTGTEFVSGSFDKSVRIFPLDKGRSREVYHTKRMQRVVCVKWSLDNNYILSGSDEMNIRLWKANASQKLGTLRPREREAFEYGAALKEKYAAHPQIRRIARHRHVPKAIYAAAAEHRTIRTAAQRKEANVRAHSKKGKVPFVSAKKKVVIQEFK